MVERDPLIGRQLGAYQIQLKLGEGGMALVYKAYHARLRRDVAIKVILAHIAGHGDFRARFEQEAQLIASLEHPNIVAIYDFGEEGTIPYLVMQYVGGGTLRDQLQDGYPLAPQQATYYALQMARALHAAHQRGIVHRDVKPQNMLVSANSRDQLLLSDFGIAKLFDSSQDNTWLGTTMHNNGYTGSKTSADQILGTLEYIAPEQINHKDVDARTDVYALGVVLFQMLTGRVPFLSSTTTGLMYQHVYITPPLVSDLNPAIPITLAQITAKALEKAPEARFQSAQAMAQALESLMNGGGLSERFTNEAPPSTAYNDGRQPLARDSDIRATPGIPSYETPSAPGSTHGQQISRSLQGQNTGSTPGTSTPDHATTAGRQQNSIPVHPGTHDRKPISMQMIVGIVVLVVALALLVMRFQFFTGGNSTSQTIQSTGPATAFTETFANNNAGWIEGSTNGLTASVNSGQYTLNLVPANTYFPYPSKIGSLPADFTLTAEIRQDKGNTAIAYGVVFDLNVQTKSCYAFFITGDGKYAILRYDNGTSNSPLWAGQSGTILSTHKSNTLQATVRNGTFSFKINGRLVPLKNGTSMKDTTYKTGQLGLLVAGPDAQFTVTKVQLAIP
jgi:serine/threonine protein kinase